MNRKKNFCTVDKYNNKMEKKWRDNTFKILKLNQNYENKETNRHKKINKVTRITKLT